MMEQRPAQPEVPRFLARFLALRDEVMRAESGPVAAQRFDEFAVQLDGLARLLAETADLSRQAAGKLRAENISESICREES
ncbi:MAG TPA: hypothetical protein VGL06_12910 [Pseudonocardiaceae bacterium]